MIDQYSVSTSSHSVADTTNAYVLGSTDGLLIDPAGRCESLKTTCQAGVNHVAVTHHHPDHIEALDWYAEQFDLTVWCRKCKTSAFQAATGRVPDRCFVPGEVISAAGGVEILDTPGHTPEHTAFVRPEGMVTGDLAVASGSVVVGSPEGDMRAYLSSLRRVAARKPVRLYPGHGPVIDNPRETCWRLIAHRKQRERRVLAAIEAGNHSLDGIVQAAYEKEISDVYDLARQTVVAHIEKLAVEDKVEWDGSATAVR